MALSKHYHHFNLSQRQSDRKQGMSQRRQTSILAFGLSFCLAPINNFYDGSVLDESSDVLDLKAESGRPLGVDGSSARVAAGAIAMKRQQHRKEQAENLAGGASHLAKMVKQRQEDVLNEIRQFFIDHPDRRSSFGSTNSVCDSAYSTGLHSLQSTGTNKQDDSFSSITCPHCVVVKKESPSARPEIMKRVTPVEASTPQKKFSLPERTSELIAFVRPRCYSGGHIATGETTLPKLSEKNSQLGKILLSNTFGETRNDKKARLKTLRTFAAHIVADKYARNMLVQAVRVGKFEEYLELLAVRPQLSELVGTDRKSAGQSMPFILIRSLAHCQPTKNNTDLVLRILRLIKRHSPDSFRGTTQTVVDGAIVEKNLAQIADELLSDEVRPLKRLKAKLLKLLPSDLTETQSQKLHHLRHLLATPKHETLEECTERVRQLLQCSHQFMYSQERQLLVEAIENGELETFKKLLSKFPRLRDVKGYYRGVHQKTDYNVPVPFLVMKGFTKACSRGPATRVTLGILKELFRLNPSLKTAKVAADYCEGFDPRNSPIRGSVPDLSLLEFAEKIVDFESSQELKAFKRNLEALLVVHSIRRNGNRTSSDALCLAKTTTRRRPKKAASDSLLLERSLPRRMWEFICHPRRKINENIARLLRATKKETPAEVKSRLAKVLKHKSHFQKHPELLVEAIERGQFEEYRALLVKYHDLAHLRKFDESTESVLGSPYIILRGLSRAGVSEHHRELALELLRRIKLYAPQEFNSKARMLHGDVIEEMDLIQFASHVLPVNDFRSIKTALEDVICGNRHNRVILLNDMATPYVDVEAEVFPSKKLDGGVITNGFNPADGPKLRVSMRDGPDPKLVAPPVVACLELMKERNLKILLLPCLKAGPDRQESALAVLNAINSWFAKPENKNVTLETIYINCPHHADARAYEKLMRPVK